MNHSSADDSGRPPASAAGDRQRGEIDRLNTEAERQRVRPELAAWHERFFASPLPELLKERTHLKFRDLRSQRREREAGEARTLVEAALAAGALAQLPALANRLGQAAAITGESATSEACFVAATTGLPEGPARSVVLQNLLMVQLDRRENGAVARTIGELAKCAPNDLPLPLARFEIIRPLGLSMFGMVFLCKEIATGRRVVVKSPPESPPGRLAPLRETEILRRLNHPGVPVCYDLGHVDPAGRRPYYVLEWFDGISLHDYVARCGPLSWANF